MASILKLEGSSSISSRTRMPKPRRVMALVVGRQAAEERAAARRASADDETDSMVDWE